MENPTLKLSSAEDRSSALAVASGSPVDSLEAHCERLSRICRGWAEAANASQQPETFYEGYSEAVMRAMQCMLTEARADHADAVQHLFTCRKNISELESERDALRRDLHIAEQAISLGNEDLEEVRNMLGEAQARADYEYKKQKSLAEELETVERNIVLCARYALGIRVDEGHEYFEGLRQTTNDVLKMAREHKAAMALLTDIVRQYEAAPDGTLGCGFTNGPFLAAKDFLANDGDEARGGRQPIKQPKK